MTTSPQKPDPDYAYMDVEREFLAGGHVKFANEKARDTLVQFYNVTVGHYLTEMQPQYSWDLWRHDESFRRMILEEVRVMAAELRESSGETADRTHIFEAGKAVLRRIRARTEVTSPWRRFEQICLIDRRAKSPTGGG
jgi:hypothetical protein